MTHETMRKIIQHRKETKYYDIPFLPMYMKRSCKLWKHISSQSKHYCKENKLCGNVWCQCNIKSGKEEALRAFKLRDTLKPCCWDWKHSFLSYPAGKWYSLSVYCSSNVSFNAWFVLSMCPFSRFSFKKKVRLNTYI